MTHKYAFACVRIKRDTTVLIAPFVTDAADFKEASEDAKVYNQSHRDKDIVDTWEVGMKIEEN